MCDHATCKNFSLREVTIETCQYNKANNRIQVIYFCLWMHKWQQKKTDLVLYAFHLLLKRETKVQHEWVKACWLQGICFQLFILAKHLISVTAFYDVSRFFVHKEKSGKKKHRYDTSPTLRRVLSHMTHLIEAKHSGKNPLTL